MALATLILDIAVILVLIGTLVFAFRLNGALRRLRQDREELAKLVSSLNEATTQAGSAMAGLREAAGEVDAAFEQRRAAGESLLEELRLITVTAERLAKRIEQASLGIGQALTPKAVAPTGEDQAEDPVDDLDEATARHEAENKVAALLESLKGDPETRRPAEPRKRGWNFAKAGRSDDAAQAAAPEPAAATPRPAAKTPSRMEQTLMDAMSALKQVG